MSDRDPVVMVGILGLVRKLITLPYRLLLLPCKIVSTIVGIVVWIVILAVLGVLAYLFVPL